MSKKAKIIILLSVLTIVIGLLVIAWSIYWLCFGTITKRDIKYYNELVDDITLMPRTSDIGEYENLDFKYYHKNMIIFESDSYTLVAQYDDTTYFEQKDILENKYEYGEKAIIDINGHSLAQKFSIGTFEFKVLSFDNYQEVLDYPKQMIFIGTSDDTCEIAYIYCFDWDLDYITSFEDFLITQCDWS